jgi:hypothetical protein
MSNPIRDLTGQRFGRLKVRWPAGIGGHHVYWLASCRCGNLTIVKGTHLTSGGVQSCGCLVRDTSRELIRRKHPCLRHGDAKKGHVTAEHVCWQSMRRRCENPKDGSYKNYGARGIKVCPRWHVFENFLADMGRKPSPQHSIDRFPDNDGNYEPGNCRWATRSQQMLNRRPCSDGARANIRAGWIKRKNRFQK